MDWTNVTADVNKILPTHFTPGREGRKIDRIILHHNAGNLSIDQIYNVWIDREASAHYQVDVNGTIGQLVWDSDTAWHSGDWDTNLRSIGIEHANNAVGEGKWDISDATLEAGAHLVAALCRVYHLGRPAMNRNVFLHSQVSPTYCPGPLRDRHLNRYMARAGEYYDQMTGAAPQPVAPDQDFFGVEVAAQAVIRGEYGNGEQRRAALGAYYDQVQARVNQILGAAASAPAFDVEAAAQAVIRGEYGNGEQRRAALGAYYDQVQARVNQILLD